MMTQYRSEELSIPYGVEVVYPVLSDLKTLDELKDDPMYKKIQDVRFGQDVCYITLSPIGEVCLRVIERKEFELVSLMGDDTLPFKLFFYIRVFALSATETKVQLEVEAELSAILRMIAGPAINDFLIKVSEAVAKIDYPKLYNKIKSK